MFYSHSNPLTPKAHLPILLLCILNLLAFENAFSQHYKRTDTIPVRENGTWLKNPWAGGHNYCEFSEIDLNFDGIRDLFVFDRTGHKVTTYINKGIPNTVNYIDSTAKYAQKFPHLEDWVLLRDYNSDGKPDIFTSSNNGIRVWKNTSSGGNLEFTLQQTMLKSTYCQGIQPVQLAITGVDIPSIDDIDGDGDLDILTYDAGGINMQYHVNQSKELGFGSDSLIFKMDCNGCWGNYRMSISGCNVTLGTCKRAGSGSDSLDPVNNHAGNCSLCLDLDGDGDKDLLLGQLGCCNYIKLTNTGNTSFANMTAMDEHFPSSGAPAVLNNFPCGYFLDLNNDHKRDLLVSPNAPNISLPEHRYR
jgi:FG-GAP-like repeat